MVPLVSLVVPAQAAIALAAPVMLVNNVGKVIVLRGSLDRAFFRRTMLGAIPGAVGGALLVGLVPELLLRRAIGIFLWAYVVWEVLGRRRVSSEAGRGVGVVAWGFMTGVISALLGAGGPTNAASMNAAGLTRESFVATGAAISVAVQLIKLPVFAWNGALRLRDWPIALALCVVAVVAALAGRAVLRRMSDRVFRVALLASLVGLGLSMLYR